MNKQVIALLTLVILMSLPVAAAVEHQHLLPLQGTIKKNANPMSEGDIIVEIWDAPTNGNLIYNSSDDFRNIIISGQYDVILGNGTQPLSLVFAQRYFMEVYINGTEVDFNGSERQVFMSNVGNVSMITPIHTNSTDDDDALNVSLGGAFFGRNVTVNNSFSVDNFFNVTATDSRIRSNGSIITSGKLRSTSNDTDDALNISNGGTFIGGDTSIGEFFNISQSTGITSTNGTLQVESGDLNDALNVTGGVIVAREIGSNFTVGSTGWNVDDSGVMQTRSSIGSGGSVIIRSNDGLAFTVNNGFNISDTNDMKTNGSITVTAGGTAQVPSAITVDDDVVVGFGNVGLGAADAAIDWDATNTRWVFAGGNDVMGPATLFRVDPLQLGNATFNISEVNSLVQTNLSVEIESGDTDDALNVSQGGATIAGNAASDGAFRINSNGQVRIQNDDLDDALNVTVGGASFASTAANDGAFRINSNGQVRIQNNLPNDALNVSQGGATIAGNAASDGAFRITNTGKTRIQNNDVDDALNVTGGAAFGLASGTQTIAIGETTDRFVINEASNIAMGSDQGTQQLHLDIYDGGTNKCSYITLYDDGGNARFMWFDNTGDMRTNNGPPTNNDCNTLGTVVGTQS